MRKGIMTPLKWPSVVILFLLPTLCYVSITTSQDWVRLFPDDAFYYLQIAWNTATAGIVSFDGVNLTNGFHPLQFAFLTAMALTESKEFMMQAAITLNALLVILCAMIVARHVMRGKCFSVVLFTTAVLGFPFWYLYLWLSAGMEVGFVFLFGCLFFLSWHEALLKNFKSNSHNLLWGMFAGLIVLSRLDMVIPLVFFYTSYLFIRLKSEGLRADICYPLLVLLLVMAPYLVWNAAMFGHLFPVSAVVKSGAVIDIQANWRALTMGNPLGLIIVFLPLILNVCAIVLVKSKSTRFALFILLASELLWYVYMFAIAKQVFRWYIAYPYVAQAIGLAFIMQSLDSREWFVKASGSRALITIGLVVVFVGQSAIYAVSTRMNTVSSFLYEVTDDINRKLDSKDVLAVFDAGVIGFFATPRVINLDGLVNSYQYVEETLKPQRFSEYFQQQGISHFLARQTAIKQVTPDSDFEFLADRRLRFESQQVLGIYKNAEQFDLTLFALNRSAN